MEALGFLKISEDPLAKVKLTSANDSAENGPVAELTVQGSKKTKTLFVSRVTDCVGADRKREGELSSLMVCKDGAAVQIVGPYSEQNWIDEVKSALRIDSVKTP